MTHEGVAPAVSFPAAGDGALMTGFPPAPQAQVTLANWQDPPFNRWAFRHMRELIPSQLVAAGSVAPLAASALALPDPPVWRLDGSTATAAEVFAGTYTDALVVLHDGQLVTERYGAGMTAATPHLLMSVSKSIVGCVAGVLADRGLLDPGAPVTAYVPEAEPSGYAGATVRDLLDMRTGVAFRDHLRSAGFGHPRRRYLGHRARPGQVRADAHRRRHGPGLPGGARVLAGRHPRPGSWRP